MLRCFLLLIALFTSFTLWGAIQLPVFDRPIVDTVGLLNSSEKSELENQIRMIRSKNGPQIGVLIVNSLDGYAIEDYSYQAAKTWKLGDEKKDDGLLLFMAIQDRKMRIEVGSGLEGDITDYESHQYISKILKPSFRQGQFAKGINLFLLAIEDKFKISELPKQFKDKLYAQEAQLNLDPPYHPGWGLLTFIILLVLYPVWKTFFQKNIMARGLYLGGAIGLFTFMVVTTSLAIIFVLAIFGFIIGLMGLGNFLLMLASSSGSGRRGGGGFGGGGGWSGGGGGFSGGGSSGNW